MISTILVTGGTGNLGSEVVRQLVAAGVSVRALVRNPQKAAGLPPGVTPVARPVAGMLTALVTSELLQATIPVRFCVVLSE